MTKDNINFYTWNHKHQKNSRRASYDRDHDSDFIINISNKIQHHHQTRSKDAIPKISHRLLNKTESFPSVKDQFQTRFAHEIV